MENKLELYRERIENQIKEAIPNNHGSFGELYEAMAYSLYAGGKRIRPLLMQLAYEAVGGKETITPYLCAIEMIHNHKVFGEATAILAGDALLNGAFEMMLEDALNQDDMNRVRAAHVLAEASGARGMIGGQILDMQSEGKQIDKDTLDSIHLHKTGALIAAAVHMGALLGGASSNEVTALTFYGKYLGKVFQIIDDVLDATSTVEELGKPIHSDMKNEKNTYLSFYDVDTCYSIAEELTTKAIKCLERVEGDTSLLEHVAFSLVQRRN